LQIENVQTPRPMTHDLLKNIIDDMQAKVEQVVISDVADSTYYAVVHLTTASGPAAVDARPSDAIALALRSRAPIMVEPKVLEQARSVDIASEKQDTERLQHWLEALDPDDMGKYKM
jgi:bifunctional DNase/RNase